MPPDILTIRSIPDYVQHEMRQCKRPIIKVYDSEGRTMTFARVDPDSSAAAPSVTNPNNWPIKKWRGRATS